MINDDGDGDDDYDNDDDDEILSFTYLLLKPYCIIVNKILKFPIQIKSNYSHVEAGY